MGSVQCFRVFFLLLMGRVEMVNWRANTVSFSVRASTLPDQG